MSCNRTMLISARAEALFTSPLPVGGQPTRAQVMDAIQLSVRAHRGVRGCAAEMAAVYGERPEVAAPRMRWAREVVTSIYG
jgi:hypothetical protein